MLSATVLISIHSVYSLIWLQMTFNPKKIFQFNTSLHKHYDQPYWILPQQNATSGEPWINWVEYNAHQQEVYLTECLILFFNIWGTWIITLMLNSHKLPSKEGGKRTTSLQPQQHSTPTHVVCRSPIMQLTTKVLATRDSTSCFKLYFLFLLRNFQYWHILQAIF